MKIILTRLHYDWDKGLLGMTEVLDLGPALAETLDRPRYHLTGAQLTKDVLSYVYVQGGMHPDSSRVTGGSIIQWVADQYAARGGADPLGLIPSESFTMAQLRTMHERCTGKELMKDTFRRNIRLFLCPIGRTTEGTHGRPAQLFSLRPKRVIPSTTH